MAERILIIGGVAAGMSAASRARRGAPDARITVLERGPVAAYGACGLPAFLAGEVGMQALVVYSTEYFRERRQIEVLTGHEAIEILPSRKQVRAKTATGEKLHDYDRLIIATGARPALAVAGADHRLVFRANTWEEAERLDTFCRQRQPRQVAVIGAGYIGLEVAEALARRGLAVRVFERAPSVLASFDADMAELVAQAARAQVKLELGVALHRVRAPGAQGLRLETAQGDCDVDCAVDCAGLQPNVHLAAAAGVALGATGAIRVDERQQTNLAAVWAAGDCAETLQVVSGRPTWIPLGPAANKQGRVAGQNAAGGPPARFSGVLGSLALRIFGVEAGRTGLSTEQARQAGFQPRSERIEANTLAGYVGRHAVTLKIIYDAGTRRLLGCQLVGEPGTVMARLQAAAVALTARLPLEEIETLDLAYAPALAPLYEPLLIAVHNALRG